MTDPDRPEFFGGPPKGKCQRCGDSTKQDLCDSCDLDNKRIDKLIAKGHTHHCACRMAMGDGECECGKTGYIPGIFSRAISGHCVVCGFKECRCSKEYKS